MLTVCFVKLIQKKFCSCSDRFPFDRNNPIGYLIAVVIEYIIIDYELLIVACTLGLGIGMYWFAISVAKEIKRILRSINIEAQTDEIPAIKVKILFSEYIDTQAAIKQLSIYLNYRKFNFSKDLAVVTRYKYICLRYANSCRNWHSSLKQTVYYSHTF